jgi:hypothetical protein
MSQTLRSVLPPIYEGLLPDDFDRPAVDEPRATCDDCAMCEGSKALPAPSGHFRADTKCCTFHPALPNYLVGALLSDPDPALDEGKKRVRAKLAARIGVTPLRVAPPRTQRVLLEAARGMNTFGRTRALLCPYFVDEGGGLCGVWRHRESVCTTYFCKYGAGARGYAFWTKLKEYLTYVEDALAKFAVRAVDPTVSEPQVPHLQITVEDLEGRPPADRDYARWWGKWVGREEEFYLACAERVRGLGREGFARVAGGSPLVRDAAAQLMARRDQIDDTTVPASLVRNPKAKVANVDGTLAVTTFNPCDSIAVPEGVYDALSMFKADEPVKKVLKRVKQKRGVEIGPELLRELVVHSVLVSPGAATDPDAGGEDPR